jgi:hypothetical protein
VSLAHTQFIVVQVILLIPRSGVVNNYRRGEEAYCLNIQGIILSLHCQILKINAVHSSEKSVTIPKEFPMVVLKKVDLLGC